MTERRLKDRMRQNRRKAKKRLRRKLIFAGLIAVFVLLIVLCVYLGLRSYVNRIPEDQILDNVFIGTVEVSGMSREEAKTAVESHYQEHLGYTAVLRVQDESAEATMEELGLKAVDLDGLVEEALAYGRSGSVWSRFKKIRGLKKEKAVIEENFSLNEETAKAVLNERVAPLAALTRGERVRETMLVQKLLEYIFEGEPFTARCAIDCWINRRGGCPAELDTAARTFANDLIKRDWATSVSCGVTGSKNLLSPVNDKRYQVREPR